LKLVEAMRLRDERGRETDAAIAGARADGFRVLRYVSFRDPVGLVGLIVDDQQLRFGAL